MIFVDPYDRFYDISELFVNNDVYLNINKMAELTRLMGKYVAEPSLKRVI